ncbi:hypothetical protein [Enterobacter cloacae]|uniref:hypothetical protein n=1 Tax=Enterobacter cloacae TaxID=550 RepID=UPI0026A92A45
MGVELHITRAEFWADNEDAQITADEWLNYINNDNELSRYIINGDYNALWSGHSFLCTKNHGLTGAQVIFIPHGPIHTCTERCCGLQDTLMHK